MVESKTLGTSFPKQKLSYKYRVLRQRLRPIVERVAYVDRISEPIFKEDLIGQTGHYEETEQQ
jgi:hypothetical protein